MARTAEEKRIAAREANQRWYNTHRDQARAAACKWRKAHPEQHRESSRKRYEAHPERVRETARKRQFGVTPEEYAQRLVEQNGVCAICGGNRSKKALGVDHDHETGKVRGLLCSPCNSALGLLLDDPELLQKAIEYLKN